MVAEVLCNRDFCSVYPISFDIQMKTIFAVRLCFEFPYTDYFTQRCLSQKMGLLAQKSKNEPIN